MEKAVNGYLENFLNGSSIVTPSVTAMPCQTFGVPPACFPHSGRQAPRPRRGSSLSQEQNLCSKPLFLMNIQSGEQTDEMPKGGVLRTLCAISSIKTSFSLFSHDFCRKIMGILLFSLSAQSVRVIINYEHIHRKVCFSAKRFWIRRKEANR